MNGAKHTTDATGLARPVAFVVWLVAAIDAAIVVTAAAFAVGITAGEGSLGEAAGAIAIYGLMALYGVVGALVATRRPRNPVGWMLWIAATMLVVTIVSGLVVEFFGGQAAADGDVPVVIDTLLSTALYLILVFVPLHFPDGSLPSPRWRMVRWYAVLALVAQIVAPALRTSGASSTVDGVISALGTIAILLALLSVAVRYRSGDRTLRQQIKWFAAAAAVAAGGFLAASLPFENPGWNLFLIGLALVPVAVGIAVLRYRLYEIDRIISRTISWALVTGTLAAAFLGLVIASSAMFQQVAGDSTLAVAGSTLVVFALFQPLRRRVQRAVDRRFDRARYDAERTATAFAARLRDDVDLASVQGDLLGVVARSVQPKSAMIWMRADVRRPTR